MLTAEPAEDLELFDPEGGKVTEARALTQIMAAPAVDDVTVLPLLLFGFHYFKNPLDLDQIRQALKERLMEIPRFRSVVRLRGKKTVFVECDRERIPMETMVQELPIRSKEEVDAFCSRVYAERMTTQLPLWRGYLFNDMEDGRSCLCLVIDHTIADGVALVATLMSILDDREEAASGSAGRAGPAAPRKRAVQGPNCCARASAAVGGCYKAFCRDPPDPPNRLKLKNHREPGKVKAVSQSDAIPLEKIKEVAAAFGGNCTVNDVMMAILTLALQSYFAKCEPATLNQRLRAIFMVSLRPQGADMLSEKYYGNKFTNGRFAFPMHLKSPTDVFQECKRQTDYVKMSPEPLIDAWVTEKATNSGRFTAQEMWDKALDLYGSCTAMLSNVMGPSEEVSFCGQPLDDLQFYALSCIGIYFGIVSYNGKVSVGVVADKACEPDAGKLASEWMGAFDRLYAAAATRAKP